MTITMKVRRVGNSLGLILTQKAAQALEVEEGDTLFFTASPDGMRLTPYRPDLARQLEVMEEIMREDRNVLRALAK